MNLAERYMRGFSWGIWRDTHLLLEGKAVHGLQTAFLLDWYFVDRTLITSTRYFPKIENCGTSLAQIVTSEPVGPWKDIMQGLVISISSAKKYFYIQTPYFLPTEAVLVAMQTAALSGVDVRLMLPMRADNRLTHLVLDIWCTVELRSMTSCPHCIQGNVTTFQFLWNNRIAQTYSGKSSVFRKALQLDRTCFGALTLINRVRYIVL